MPYIKGGNLKEMQEIRQRLDYVEVARLLAPIARALEYAHGKGIAHRDIKPSNILLTENGQPMLADFGIAKIFEGDNRTPQGWTEEGRAIGTPEYMSREQWLGLEIDGRTDIYSLGVVFYELITGQVTFKADTYPMVMNKMLHDPLKSPREFVSDLSERVEHILLKALARDRENRYGDMGQFAVVLEKLTQRDTEQKPAQIPGVKQEPTKPNATTSEDLISEGAGTTKKSNWWKGYRVGIGLGNIIFDRLFFVKHSIAEPKNGTQSPQTTHTVPSQSADNLEPGIGSTRTREKDGMVMVYVPAGPFIMGDDTGEENEKPQHTVNLEAFWIDKTEVTNGMLDKCYRSGPCQPPKKFSSTVRQSYFQDNSFVDYPVIFVTWYNAETYCEWVGSRLPVEAEWEKAARGTDGRIYPWGDKSPDDSAANSLLNYKRNVNDTSQVGNYPAGISPYGALDMAGNVWEWVADGYYIYPGGNKDLLNTVASGSRIVRGGSWLYDSIFNRVTHRLTYSALGAFSDLGFRCVSDVVQ